MPNEALLHPHIAEEMAHLFTAANSSSPEDEYLKLIVALIVAFKPATGWINLEQEGQNRVEIACAGFLWKTVWGDTPHEDPEKKLDFVFLDGLPLPKRADDLAMLIDRGYLAPRAIVVIHDTSRCRTLKDGTLDPEAAEFWERMERMVIRKHRPRAVLELPLSRGLCLIQV